jgi:excisionase family DNA binding protein
MVDPIAYTISQAAAAAAAGKTIIYAAIKAGELPARKRGRRTVILAADLRAWVDGLPTIKLKPKQRQAPSL